MRTCSTVKRFFEKHPDCGISDLRSHLYETYRVQVIDEGHVRREDDANTPSEDRRILFNNIYESLITTKKVDFIHECNGLVLQQDTWKPISVPPRNLWKHPSMKRLGDNLENYEVYEAVDGTLMTLYHWNNSWVLSTPKAYDANKMKILGVSYEQMYKEAIAQFPEFDEKKLDKNYCYSIIVRNPNLHIFQHPKIPATYAWFVQSVNLDTFEVSRTTNIGLPLMSPISVTSVDDLITKVKSSHRDFLTNTTDTPLFGYVFRAKNTDDPDFFVESQLQTAINIGWYSTIAESEKITKELRNAESKNVHLVNVFLHLLDVENFIKLFPVMENDINALETKFSRLCNDVMNAVSYKSTKHTNSTVNMLAAEISQRLTINVNDNELKSKVRDLVKSLISVQDFVKF